MSPLYSLCLFVGIALVVIAISKVRDWPTPQLFRKRVKPEDVRISPEALQQMRDELVFHAIKREPTHVVHGSQQKGNFR